MPCSSAARSRFCDGRVTRSRNAARSAIDRGALAIAIRGACSGSGRQHSVRRAVPYSHGRNCGQRALPNSGKLKRFYSIALRVPAHRHGTLCPDAEELRMDWQSRRALVFDRHRLRGQKASGPKCARPNLGGSSNILFSFGRQHRECSGGASGRHWNCAGTPTRRVCVALVPRRSLPFKHARAAVDNDATRWSCRARPY